MYKNYWLNWNGLAFHWCSNNRQNITLRWVVKYVIKLEERSRISVHVISLIFEVLTSCYSSYAITPSSMPSWPAAWSLVKRFSGFISLSPVFDDLNLCLLQSQSCGISGIRDVITWKPWLSHTYKQRSSQGTKEVVVRGKAMQRKSRFWET